MNDCTLTADECTAIVEARNADALRGWSGTHPDPTDLLAAVTKVLSTRAADMAKERNDLRTALRETRERYSRIETTIRGDEVAAAYIATTDTLVTLLAGLATLRKEAMDITSNLFNYDLARRINDLRAQAGVAGL